MPAAGHSFAAELSKAGVAPHFAKIALNLRSFAIIFMLMFAIYLVGARSCVFGSS
jgi:hypothetical protein